MQEQPSLLSDVPAGQLSAEALGLLRKLISIPSFSKEESGTAEAIAGFFREKGITVNRKGNNVWAFNKYFRDKLPVILLNSHHDTVKPNAGYTNDPFEPIMKDGKLFGLGSNDAGGPLVSLTAAFLHYYDKPDLKYNIILAATAEEEISGRNGVELVLPELPKIDVAIVGEPTLMHLAIAERGLVVLDCVAKGRAGHAAREEGDNAIYKAMQDIEWFKTYQFPKHSEMLGPVKMNVTMINAGTQHNVIPGECCFVVDVRTTDVYTNEEVLEVINQHVKCQVKPRSVRLTPSSISKDHPLVQAGIKLGRKTYGSPTSSDQALMNFPSLKLGPGDSARSHTADEFIYVKEIEEGIDIYIKMLNEIV